ncbi:LemA family protein [Wenzhouxiangella sp. XN79A]|uniref:LemA family protein n=1 Tax=Wenzhouxiangella sp. XN79A TaxID=2724193 RepID=UPI00144A5F11|nr:LemA family protein [Wenzhouxiangella sp. XN79A]NKI34019.1 LemA family protein [Wenzhouxiangella sp. XN79A]
MEISLIIALAAGLAVLVWAVVIFNRLVRARNLVRAGFADIDVQLQKRHDLVPQLVEAVRAYAGFEQRVLEDVTRLRGEARQQVDRVDDVAGRDAAEQALAGGLGRLILLAEAYPELKAGENFRQLVTELTDVEDDIEQARRFYNGAVRQLNDRVQHVPDRFVAGPFGFGEEAFFSAGIETRRAPDVGRALRAAP